MSIHYLKIQMIFKVLQCIKQSCCKIVITSSFCSRTVLILRSFIQCLLRLGTTNFHFRERSGSIVECLTLDRGIVV